jgi:hypothetical protein
MRTRIKQLSLAGSIAALAASSGLADVIGQWDFESGNLNGTVGAALEYADTLTQDQTAFGTTTTFAVPNIAGTEAKLVKVPASTNGVMGYIMPVNTGPLGGDLVNAYTVIMDVLFPAESNSKWRALLNVETTLDADADFFVNNDNAIGIDGAYAGTVLPNTWHRIGWVVDYEANLIRKYIDGFLVGAQPYGGIDERYALTPGGTAVLFNDNDGESALGYVNSIQLRNEALTTPQMRAMGAASSSGIPQTVPPIPSGIERFIPSTEFASRDTAVGAIIALGATTIQDSSISVSLNGAAIANPTITRDSEFVTARSAAQNLTPGQKYTNVIAYTDSIAGAKRFTSVFTAALFFEDFDSIVLGTSVEEAFTEGVWTNVPPTGWNVNNTNMVGFGGPDDDGNGFPDGDGITEWFGWTFAKRDWWVQVAGDQERSKFTLSTGTAAVADPDEWDDAGHDVGFFNSDLRTPEISLTGVAANTAFLRFSSSWRPEGKDDGPPKFPEGNINNQTAVITVSYDGGAPIEVLKWDSVEGSSTFHPDAPNETVTVLLNNPAGAQKAVLSFSLLEAANDWWWAIDNVVVSAGASAPSVSIQPIGGWVSRGGQAVLAVHATGTEPFTYQWKRDGTNIAGATGLSFTLNAVQASDAGVYSVRVSNAGGSVESRGAGLFVYSGALTNGLVTHLKFDGDYADSSGRTNDASAAGAPDFQTGKVGQSVHIPSGTDYVTLGTPADLNFGVSTDFSISFWGLVNQFDGDPSFIGNKDWDSGGNQGYVLFTESNRRIDWNISGPGGSRRDGDAVAEAFPSNTWAHVVVTFDRDGIASTYVNGERRATFDISGNPINLDTPEGFATNIGQDGAGDYGSVFMDLRIDDLGIWRRVLTAQEAKAIYEAGATGKDLSQAVFGGDQETVVTGQWDFDNGDLSATVGSALQYRGDTQNGTSFATMDIGGQPAKVMRFPAATAAQGYVMPHGAAANGGGTNINQYTLILDLMFPAESDKKWRGLFQTNPNNADDGDLFVNTGNGIGISGNYTGTIQSNTWHRVAFVVNAVAGTLAKYIDGVKVGQQTIAGVDGRFSLQSTALLLTDEDNETATGFVNSIQFRNGLMTDTEIAALGGATAGGIGSTAPTGVHVSIARSGANLVIAAQSPGTYQLQKKAALSDAAWTNVGTPGAGPFTVPAEGAKGFFRLAQ